MELPALCPLLRGCSFSLFLPARLFGSFLECVIYPLFLIVMVHLRLRRLLFGVTLKLFIYYYWIPTMIADESSSRTSVQKKNAVTRQKRCVWSFASGGRLRCMHVMQTGGGGACLA